MTPQMKRAEEPIGLDGPFPDLPIDAFLYGHQGPWPQPSRDHPFGLTPGIYSIPDEEWADWAAHVGAYYEGNAIKFGQLAALHSVSADLKWKLDHPKMSDADFNRLISEGLYSKFLTRLDAREERVFADYIKDPNYDYWKSDYSCMRVVRKVWAGETVAASVVILRKPKNDTGYNYESVALQLQVWNKKTNKFDDSEIFTPADGEAWDTARYFVLQGAIHRINLIDHTEVHFPPDAVNAITKTVLPKNNLILRLLQPHLWLSLPVNNTVLEGQRSIINRNTWYPWSPFVAKGDEVRKLLPFGWYGSGYYADKNGDGDPNKDPYFNEPNSSYPRYEFRTDPPAIPSHYGEYLNSYFPPILKFTSGIVEQMTDTDWKEAGYWAHHIAVWLPGFPGRHLLFGEDGHTFNKELMAKTLAHVIWNGSVRHSADHQTLHEMIDGRTGPDGKQTVPPQPVPFILRVVPPMTKDYKLTAAPIKDSDEAQFSDLEQAEQKWVNAQNPPPLCWPFDPMSAHLADLLFYVPHNSCCLADVGVSMDGDHSKNYAFDTPELIALVEQFHADLKELDAKLQQDPKKYFVPLSAIASSIQY